MRSVLDAGPSPLAGGPRPVLEVRDLTKVFVAKRRGQPDTLANDRLTLDVREGQVVALLGPNGAGKSTFLRQIAGQLLPTSGSIRVAGVDMVADPLEAKSRLAAIPQECQPILSLTVEEEVLAFGLLKGLDRREAPAEVDRVLEAIGLTDSRTKLVRELSGGYKRRVLIAIALAGPRPRLMLLDEPTTGLDPEARRDVWKLVHRLRAGGLAILLTTHYIEEAEHLADEVVIIDRGTFALRGSVADLRARLPYRGRVDIRGVDRLGPVGRAHLERLPRSWTIAFRSEDYWRLQVPDPFSPETAAELGALARDGVEASLAPASLEDAYLSVVGKLSEAGR